MQEEKILLPTTELRGEVPSRVVTSPPKEIKNNLDDHLVATKISKFISWTHTFLHFPRHSSQFYGWSLSHLIPPNLVGGLREYLSLFFFIPFLLWDLAAPRSMAFTPKEVSYSPGWFPDGNQSKCTCIIKIQAGLFTQPKRFLLFFFFFPRKLMFLGPA